MARKLSYEEIADLHELRVINTTEGANGYPRNVAWALIGFDNFTQAERVAKKYGGEIRKLHKRVGWQLWEDQGWENEPIRPHGDMYGEDYGTIYKMTKEEFYRDEVAPRLDDIGNLNDLYSFVEGKIRLWREIDCMDDDEVIITYYGDYYETWKQEEMEWSHDTHKYVIGVVLNEEEEDEEDDDDETNQ